MSMPRRARTSYLLPGQPVHVLQRGHNRARCFESDADQVLYLGLLQEFSARHDCSIHAYVLMSNHVHLLVSPPEARNLSHMMRDVNQIYVQHVNRHQSRCGSTWQGRFKSCPVDSNSYFLNCQRYIELNPIRANMVEAPWLYKWSSYAFNASGRPSELLTPHPTYLRLGANEESRLAAYRAFLGETPTAEELGKIRASVNNGWPLGDDAFIRKVESEFGIKATPGLPGRPKRPEIRDGPGTDPGFRRQP